MRKALLLGAAAPVFAGLVIWSAQAFGHRSAGFAFVVVWLLMTWLGMASHVVTPRLPDRFHALRGFERDGVVYERFGVLLVKRLLRRGPLAIFNPDLRLPAERTPQALARLERRMRDAEASHVVMFVVTLAPVGYDLARTWWDAAAWTLLFNVLVNGYPVMLQRYNRGRLADRFGQPHAAI